MEDIASKLSELLESPEGLDTIKSMAGMLLGGSDDEDEHSDEDHHHGGEKNPASFGGLPVSPGDMQTIVKVMGALKSKGEDDRSRLLLALRPHLSEERQPKVDQAVKILKLISVMPLLKETNLLDMF